MSGQALPGSAYIVVSHMTTRTRNNKGVGGGGRGSEGQGGSETKGHWQKPKGRLVHTMRVDCFEKPIPDLHKSKLTWAACEF